MPRGNAQENDTQLLTTAGQILDVITTAIRVIDSDYNIVQWNAPFAKLCGWPTDRIDRRKCSEVFGGHNCHTNQCPFRKIVERGSARVEQEVVRTAMDGRHIVCRLTAIPYRLENGSVGGIIEEFVDITTVSQLEQNIELAKKTIETDQKALEAKDSALKEILSQIEQGKHQMADHIQRNVDRIVLPLVLSLKDHANSLDTKRISLIESQLVDITDSFVSNIENRFSKLTPREIQICNLIRQGLSSKEIAQLLHTSVGTVEQQRKKIRKKLGLSSTGANLTSFLKTT